MYAETIQDVVVQEVITPHFKGYSHSSNAITSVFEKDKGVKQPANIKAMLLKKFSA